MALTIYDFAELIYSADPRPMQFYQNMLSFIPPEHRQDVPLSAEPITLDEDLWGVTDSDLQVLYGDDRAEILISLVANKLSQIVHPDDIDVLTGESVLWTMRRIFIRLNEWFKKAPYISPRFLYEWFCEAYMNSNDKCFKRLRAVHGLTPPHFLSSVRAFIRYIEPLMDEMGYHRTDDVRRPLLKWWDLESLAAEFDIDDEYMVAVKNKTETTQIKCFRRKEMTN